MKCPVCSRSIEPASDPVVAYDSDGWLMCPCGTSFNPKDRLAFKVMKPDQKIRVLVSNNPTTPMKKVSEEAESLFQRTVERYCDIAKGAAFKESSELTDMERVCLAMVCGCAMDYSWNGDKLVIRTKYPVGFSKPYPNQPIRVYENRAINPGD